MIVAILRILKLNTKALGGTDPDGISHKDQQQHEGKKWRSHFVRERLQEKWILNAFKSLGLNSRDLFRARLSE